MNVLLYFNVPVLDGSTMNVIDSIFHSSIRIPNVTAI